MKLCALENTYMSTCTGWSNEAVIFCQVTDKHIFKCVYMLLYSNWGQLFPYHTGHKRYLIIVKKKKLILCGSGWNPQEFGLKAKVWSFLISSLGNHTLGKKNDPAVKNRALRVQTNWVRSPCVLQTYCMPLSTLHRTPEHTLLLGKTEYLPFPSFSVWRVVRGSCINSGLPSIL